MSKINVLVVAPYYGLQELVKKLGPELTDFEITTVIGDLSEGIIGFNERLDKQYDIVISRGGTAKLLREHTSIPVIDIEVSGYDILRILTLLKGYESKIKLIGFPNVIQGFIAVSSLVNMDISYSEVHQEAEVEQLLREAKEDGFLVVVGDNVTTHIANEMGLQGVLITSGIESVMDAFRAAEQMHNVLSLAKAQNHLLVQMFEEVEDGLAVISQDGYIRYANVRFRELIQLNTFGEIRQSLYEEHSFFQRMIRGLNRDEVLTPEPVVVYETNQKLTIFVKCLNGDQRLGSYLIKLRPYVPGSNDIEFIYHKKSNHFSYPKIIMTGEAFKKAETIAEKRIEKGVPIAMYGERGSGKKIFVDMLYHSTRYTHDSLLEVVIHRGSLTVFEQVQRVLSSDHPASLIYMTGIERLALAEQRQLAADLQMIKSHVLISFMKDLKELKEESSLDSRLYDLLSEDYVYFPPIRDNIPEFEELVRTFIVQYNEIYGKQVVGIRPKVLEVLRSHAWEGNYIELKDIIEMFVRQSTGEYIEEDLCNEVLGTRRVANNRSGETEDLIEINLNRTLDEMEKDIISAVLQRENMNQTKAAKWLGINRSTMWRKVRVEK